MKFMTDFWEHWLTSAMLISLLENTFLKVNIANHLASGKIWKNRERQSEDYTSIFQRLRHLKRTSEKTKKKDKIIYYSNLLHNYKTGSKLTLQVNFANKLSGCGFESCCSHQKISVY